MAFRCSCNVSAGAISNCIGGFTVAVIALTSSMGTGVKYVAEQVAQRLGLNLVYREICETARSPMASAAQTAPETQATRWQTGLTYLHFHRQSAALADLEDLYRLVQRDNVLICGNTPLHFLSGVTHVVKVRVRTTMALRVRRIMACMNTDESELALEKILQCDQRQADTLSRLFRIKDAESRELYDLVVDTGREPVEDCALQIVSLALVKALQPTRLSATKLNAIVEQVQALGLSLLHKEADDLAGVTTTRRQRIDLGELKLFTQPCAVVTRLLA